MATGIEAFITEPLSEGTGTLASRLTDLASAIGADIARLRRVSTVASSVTPTPIGSGVDSYLAVTALAVAAAFAAPTGTPVDGNSLLIRIKDNGTARVLTWNSIYRTIDSVNVPLPTTTVAGKWMDLTFLYNASDATWDLLAVVKQI